MMLGRVGVFGMVSDHGQSDRITRNEVADQRHIQVYRLPEDDRYVSGRAFDVVLREPADKDGTRRKPNQSWGFYSSIEQAAEAAVDIAVKHDATIWDSVYILRM
jgi:hypothetical protein